MRVVIPNEKLEEILDECRDWKKPLTTTKKRLQRLAGRLNHIAKCAQPPRRFMIRIFTALRATPYTGQNQITEGTKADVQWFINYTANTNGVVLLPHKERQVWLIECAYSPTKYYRHQYPQQTLQNTTNIAQLEAINLVTALMHLALS